jgi:hypothetical protein
MSFSELFNPGMKHLREEQQRKRIEAQIPESEGDPLRDFEQGIIRITLKDAPSQPLPDSKAPVAPGESGAPQSPALPDRPEATATAAAGDPETNPSS